MKATIAILTKETVSSNELVPKMFTADIRKTKFTLTIQNRCSHNQNCFGNSISKYGGTVDTNYEICLACM